MYEAVIGLECHVQLDVASKLFCACPVVDEGPPNRYVCPICAGHPGTLPVVNEGVVRKALEAALATSCTVHPRSIFARKQYFYPDLPKGYQISQYDRPLATGGSVSFDVEGVRRTVRLERIHIEEDAGRSYHFETWTGLDLNRAGTPLVEIVSAPDLRTPQEAEAYLRMLHRILVTLAVTRGDLEKGHFRCDANVSVRSLGAELGTRVEIKNLNSFRFVAKALAHEIERQTGVLSRGEKVVQETRTWRRDHTEPMRGKEEAMDYRYFPEPDLPPLTISEADLVSARNALPGAPMDLFLLDQDQAELDAIRASHGLSVDAARFLLGRPDLRPWFEAAVQAGGDPAAMARWAKEEVSRLLNEGGTLSESRLTPVGLVALQAQIDRGAISAANARLVFQHIWAHGGDPLSVIDQLGLAVVGDVEHIRRIAGDVISANPDQVSRYRSGKKGLIGFFMGEVMRATQGRADPKLARQVVDELLSVREES